MSRHVIETSWIDPGEALVCPNCNGTGEDPDTMICVMCGGDGRLTNDTDEPVQFFMVHDENGIDILDPMGNAQGGSA